MTYTHALCWLRRDLRLSDHAALAAACANAHQVSVAFIVDTTILDRLVDRNDRRITFLHHSLAELDRRLREMGSLLIVRIGDPLQEIPTLIRELNADALYFNRDYEPSAKERDRQIQAEVEVMGCDLHTFKDHVIYEGEEIVNRAGEPYRVFTPYKNAWLARLAEGSDEIDPTVERTPNLIRLALATSTEYLNHSWTMTDIGFTNNNLWLEAGELGAKDRLHSFHEHHLHEYDRTRNVPAIEGTSGLSVHLRFGTISTRELVRCACEDQKKDQNEGARVWLNELIWRDFYQMILDRYPHVVDHAFRLEYDRIEWPGRKEHYHAWCQGRTGYPIIDAAMRLFNATGWMHNRLRMITASFLVKDLLIDWRLGEGYFARHLLDFDLAANNGGWQWSASTGCDAQPYFRIFNPVAQSRKCDPDGAFIRTHCPELARFPNRHIHWPVDAARSEQEKAACIVGKDYPLPIVEHSEQRMQALRMYKEARVGYG